MIHNNLRQGDLSSELEEIQPAQSNCPKACQNSYNERKEMLSVTSDIFHETRQILISSLHNSSLNLLQIVYWYFHSLLNSVSATTFGEI